MSIQRLLLLVGVVVMLTGIVGLVAPVSISDGQGVNISCGNAVVEDTNAARAATERQLTNLPIIKDFVSHTDYVSECKTAVAQRRWWAIPVSLVAVAMLLGASRIRGRITASSA